MVGSLGVSRVIDRFCSVSSFESLLFNETYATALIGLFRLYELVARGKCTAASLRSVLQPMQGAARVCGELANT